MADDVLVGRAGAAAAVQHADHADRAGEHGAGGEGEGRAQETRRSQGWDTKGGGASRAILVFCGPLGSPYSFCGPLYFAYSLSPLFSSISPWYNRNGGHKTPITLYCHHWFDQHDWLGVQDQWLTLCYLPIDQQVVCLHGRSSLWRWTPGVWTLDL